MKNILDRYNRPGGFLLPAPVLLLFRKSLVSAGFSFERVNLRADGEPTGVFSIKEENWDR